MNAESGFEFDGAGRGTLIGRCRAALVDAVARMRERRSLRRELARCADDGVLDEILGELGVSRAEMAQWTAGYPRAVRLRAAMTARLGIDASTLGHCRLQRAIERNCASCPAHRRCREWLRSGARDGYEAFCPNAALFEALRAQPGARARTIL